MLLILLFRLIILYILERVNQDNSKKVNHDISNREAAKISPLSSKKFDKYEYPTGEEILRSDQGRIIEQAKFTYFPLSKAFEKQI